MEEQPHRAFEQNHNKNKTKSCHIRIDLAFYCSIEPTKNAMVSLKDGFAVSRQSQNKDFLSIIYGLSQHDV